MPAVKTLSDLNPTFTKMGTAAQKAAAAGVRASTERLARFVDAAGARHHIKGRNGQRIKLGAKVDVRGYNNASNKVVWTGAVRGVPEGFWHIVTYGSGPHLITRRGTRTTKSGRTVVTTSRGSGVLKKFADGHTFGELKPMGIPSPIGPRFAVIHPGHGSQGNPWDAAMSLGKPVVAQTVAYEQTKALTQAFLKAA